MKEYYSNGYLKLVTGYYYIKGQSVYDENQDNIYNPEIVSYIPNGKIYQKGYFFKTYWQTKLSWMNKIKNI